VLSIDGQSALFSECIQNGVEPTVLDTVTEGSTLQRASQVHDSETSFEPMKPELAESARPRRHVGCAYSLVFMTDALWQGLPCLIESAETVSPPTDDGRFALDDMYAVVTQRAFTKVA